MVCSLLKSRVLSVTQRLCVAQAHGSDLEKISYKGLHNSGARLIVSGSVSSSVGWRGWPGVLHDR